MIDLKKEREALVQATFYVDKINPNAPNLPDLLRDKFETEVDRNKIFFSICIPGESNEINIKEIIEQNNNLLHQVKFWQELYLKSISQENKN